MKNKRARRVLVHAMQYLQKRSCNLTGTRWSDASDMQAYHLIHGLARVLQREHETSHHDRG